MTVTGDTATDAPGTGRWRYEVALSFAATDRPYVERVAATLKARGVRVFYDADEQVRLWGRHLAEELAAVYAEQAAAVVVFVSAAYAERDWTRWERRAALGRAVRERREYLLPARFDDTTLPELANLADVDLRGLDPEGFADLVAAKLTDLGVTPPPAAPAGSGRGKLLWGPVPPRNPFFTGREQALADLHTRLTGQAGPVVAVSALAGMGGVGKTQLAAEYAHRHAAAYRLIWWVTASSRRLRHGKDQVGYGNNWVLVGVVVTIPVQAAWCACPLWPAVRKNTTAGSRLKLAVQMVTKLADALPGRTIHGVADAEPDRRVAVPGKTRRLAAMATAE